MARRLLVVEDDEDIREVLVEDLVERGYTVQGMANGSLALAAIRMCDGEAQDLTIVLDLMMPVMDGWELLRTIRSDAGLSAMQVIVTTGAEDTGGLPPGVPILRKPYRIADLIRAIERPR
jgi:CheY-like chemotaxis protein